MREEQKLYPQLIYRINNALSELKTEFKKLSDFNDNLFIAPSVLNPYSRTFNWLLVAEGRWNLSKSLMSEIQRKIKSSENKWNQFKKEFKKIEEVKSVADAIHSIENSENLKPEEYYSVLLFLYQSYPINNKEYFDGIIYQNLIRRAKKSDGENHRIDYAKAELLIKKRKRGELYPPVDIVFYYGEQPEEKSAISQVKNNTKISNNNFHKNYFLPFFGKYEKTFDPKTFLELKPEHFSKFQSLYIRPFYDALYGKYGNICGILTIFFSKPEKRESFIDSKANTKLIARISSYVEEIKRAALFEILQQPIEDSTDFLKHYIECIPMLQDWEKVMVWEIKKKRGKSKYAELIYCYKRYKNDKWKECEPGHECQQMCKVNFDKLKEKVITAEKKHLTTKEADIQLKNSKHIVLLEKILTRKLIPELYEDDEIKYKNIRLIYEYPSYTIFPDDEAEKYSLGLFYERQQIDLLRQMALKRREIRETIKHGTKSALLSMDVRNMSHNIASHVLAYWIQELNQLLDHDSGDNNKLKETINKSKALFRYIQHRADFLAEVATSIPCSEMSFDLKKEILNPFLNDGKPDNPYTERKDPLTGKSNIDDGIQIDSNVYVLLRYIADSEGITINFDATNKTKKIIQYKCIKKAPRVSIPSGTIGKHAIYSIFENFIRNAAKHYKGSDNGNGFIKINVSEHGKDYVKVEMIDIRKDSCNQEIVKKLNGYLKGGFVDNQGRLKSGGWGIKEMLISANFLRKNTPEDLYDIIIGRKDWKPPLLEIICSDRNTNTIESHNSSCSNCRHQKNLGIRFYLIRPKHLAFLDNIKEVNANGTNFEINKISRDEYKDVPIPHNILLVDNESCGSYKDNPLAPCRVMVYDKSCKSEGSNNVINDKIYLKLYKQFIEKEIWCDSREGLPKIVNNMDEDYRFADTQEDEENMKLSLKTLNDDAAKDNIVFVSHPEADNSREAAEKYFNLCHYFQPMSGGFSTKAKFYDNKNLPDLMRKHFYLELIEAALTKVVIVDERISEWANQNSKYFDDKSVREMLKSMNVYVPEIKKENITDKDLKKKLCRDKLGCEVFKNEKKENPHFFVIHQGILDKLKNNGNDFMEKITCRRKVIDSGRGVPEKMEHRFVQISALQTLLENYDKHGLVQTLFSLRKPVKEGQSGNQAK